MQAISLYEICLCEASGRLRKMRRIIFNIGQQLWTVISLPFSSWNLSTETLNHTNSKHKSIQLLKERYSFSDTLPPPHLDFAQSDISRYVKFANPLLPACIILYEVCSPVHLEDNTTWKANVNDALCKILLSSLFAVLELALQMYFYSIGQDLIFGGGKWLIPKHGTI